MPPRATRAWGSDQPQAGWSGSVGNAGAWGQGGKWRRVALRRSASHAAEVWSYDFDQDSTADVEAVRVHSILGEYTRECLLLKAARSFPAQRVIVELEEVMVCTGRIPQYLRSDNGPEFVAKSLRSWLEQAHVGPRYIDPDHHGKMPTRFFAVFHWASEKTGEIRDFLPG